MALMDVLNNIFGGGQQAQPAAATGAVPGQGSLSPDVMAMLQQFGFEPPDPEADRRRAIASSLAKAGQALATTPKDFGESLAGAVGTGAVEYTGQRQEQEETRRKNAMTMLNQMFGLEKLEQNLETRRSIEGLRDEDRDRRLSMLERQGDERLRQGDDRIIIMGQNADTSAKRATDADRHNRELESQGRERIANQARRDAAYIKKTESEGDAGGKSDNAFFLNQQRVEMAKVNKAKSLGLDDPTFNITDPDGWRAAKDEFDAYSTALDAELAATPSPTKRRALGATENVQNQSLKAAGAPTQKPVPPPAQAKGGVDVSDLKLPADIAPRVVRRAVKNGKTYVKLDDGRVFEVQP